MERIRAILRSGVRNINLVAPDRRCTRHFKSELDRGGFGRINVEEDCSPRSDASWCDLVVYSGRDEALVRDHVLLSRVIYPNGIRADVACALYEELRSQALCPVSVKALMRKYRLGTFYQSRAIVKSFCSSGLFMPLCSDDGRLRLLPYYYDGRDRMALVCRHLLSLGYRLTSSQGLIQASLGHTGLLVGLSLDELNGSPLAGKRILISDEGVKVNFCDVRSCTLDAFLAASRLS